jgi:hypothetical protein
MQSNLGVYQTEMEVKPNPEGGKKNRVEMLLILKLGIYVLQSV